MKSGAVLLSLLIASGIAAEATIHNDDSCDVGVFPAATLLLPHFQVDPQSPWSDTTLFTVTNVSHLPQIAHVTVWTDWAFPVLTFNIFLTGYDTQSINLYDVLVMGVIAPGGPGTSSTNTRISPRPRQPVPGAQPAPNTDNPHIVYESVIEGGTCSSLPGQLPAPFVELVRSALTTGFYRADANGIDGCGDRRIGGTHEDIRGYVTIDVVSNCTIRTPDDPAYYREDLLYDNVLLGDSIQVDGDLVVGNYAGGNPLVHIRAIPEGGRAGNTAPTPLPYTFYDRYTPSDRRTMDRRQPLPALFAARWIEGGLGGFDTNYTIWREGVSAGKQSCFKAAENSELEHGQIVRFDERENSYTYVFAPVCGCGPGDPPDTAASEEIDTRADLFPENTGIDVAGWMFLDLNHGASHNYSTARAGYDRNGFGVRPSQNWVTATMHAQGRYAVRMDAAMLGNGCSPPARDLGAQGAVIGPAPNRNPDP
jgi:hypothetical protein